MTPAASDEPVTVEGLDLLDRLDTPVHASREGPGRVALRAHPGPGEPLGAAPALDPGRLGAASFRSLHGVRMAYVAGAMAGGIGSVELVLAMARAGMMGGFGAGGLDLDAVTGALRRIREGLPGGGAYEVNLLHAPTDPEHERRTVQVLLREGVPCISASGFMTLTEPLVLYRAAGLAEAPDGRVVPRNHVMAKISRPDVAEDFMRPAPEDLLARLVERGDLSPAQAALARRVPVAEDITAEGDSGGHTDRRASIPLLTSVIAARDRLAPGSGRPVRVGAAGGLGTPTAVAAAFVAGADYVMTGSINQACVEAGTSDLVKGMLARVDVGGIDQAPAADMFELGANVQVMKTGTLFPGRARRLHRLWSSHERWEDVPAKEREQVEAQLFRAPFEEIWSRVTAYFAARDPRVLDEAAANPRTRMALVFRWYLAMSSRWAVDGDAARKVDFQVWCGPSMAAFNQWARGTPLEAPGERRVAALAEALMRGAARVLRARLLAWQGVPLPAAAFDDRPWPAANPGGTA